MTEKKIEEKRLSLFTFNTLKFSIWISNNFCIWMNVVICCSFWFGVRNGGREDPSTWLSRKERWWLGKSRRKKKKRWESAKMLEKRKDDEMKKKKRLNGKKRVRIREVMKWKRKREGNFFFKKRKENKIKK